MDIATAFGALTGATTVLRAAISARDDANITAATLDLNNRIIEIQAVCLQLQQDKLTAIEAERAQKDESRQLEQKIAELERKAQDRESYQLSELCTGTVVYTYKAGEAGIPLHHICQPCMDNAGKKSVLQSMYGQRGKIFCPTCKCEYRTDGPPPASVPLVGF